MKRIVAAALSVALLAGCSTIRQNQAADAYNAKMASNASEYGNGQIPLSEKLRRDYIAGVQYGQINKIEASCTERYMYLAKHYEQGLMTEQRFNDWRDSLEMACGNAYATGSYSPVAAWHSSYGNYLAYRR